MPPRRDDRRFLFSTRFWLIIVALVAPMTLLSVLLASFLFPRPDPICRAAESGALLGMSQTDLFERFGDPGEMDLPEPWDRFYSGSDGFVGVCFVYVQFDASGHVCDTKVAWD